MFSTVHIIDGTTYSITVSDGSLDIPVAYPAVVVVNGAAYAFSGISSVSFEPIRSWRSLSLPLVSVVAFVVC